MAGAGRAEITDRVLAPGAHCEVAVPPSPPSAVDGEHREWRLEGHFWALSIGNHLADTRGIRAGEKSRGMTRGK